MALISVSQSIVINFSSKRGGRKNITITTATAVAAPPTPFTSASRAAAAADSGLFDNPQ